MILKDNLDEEFKKGDLLIVTKDNGSEVVAGDKIFFYNSGQNYLVNYSTVVNVSDVNGDYI